MEYVLLSKQNVLKLAIERVIGTTPLEISMCFVVLLSMNTCEGQSSSLAKTKWLLEDILILGGFLPPLLAQVLLILKGLSHCG